MLEVLRQSVFAVFRTMSGVSAEAIDGETKKCVRCLRRVPAYVYKCPNCEGYRFLFDDEVMIIK